MLLLPWTNLIRLCGGASSSHTMAWLQHPLCCNEIFFIFLLCHSCFPSIMRVDTNPYSLSRIKKKKISNLGL